MKATLINDTSIAPHVGCKIVSSELRRHLEERDIELIHTVSVGSTWQNNKTKKKIKDSDLVIVNGEGTLHHGTRRAKNVVSVAPFCRDNKVPCFLINSVFEQNTREMLKQTKAFTKIFVRESFSQLELARFGIRSTVVPDLTIGIGLQETNGATFNLVTDSVDRGVSEALRKFSSKIPDSRFIRLQDRSGAFKWESSFDAFRDSSTVLTGRFHGLCLALLFKRPFLAFPSNSWKIEGLLADIGLRNRFRLSFGEIPLEFSTSEYYRINKYLKYGSAMIDMMFDEIKEWN